MILIYTDELNSRIEYISKVIFETVLRIKVVFTVNVSEFTESQLPRLNYSSKKFKNIVNIKPHPLILASGINTLDIKPVKYGSDLYFFESSDDSDLPFDPLACSFFLITRYEEYLSVKRDIHNRFIAKESLLYKYGLLKKPLVNIMARILAEKVKSFSPQLNIPKPRFSFLSTIDVDNAWAYSNKGIWRGSASYVKAVVKGDREEWRRRHEVLRKRRQDPYDTYSYIRDIFKGVEKDVYFFFLLGNYGRYDKNINPKNRNFQKLIREISKDFSVGVHPSYAASEKGRAEQIIAEKQRLETITGNLATASRFHYLKLNIPSGYRMLQKAGISEDYTMGYAADTGFRAGIATPYPFYDLEQEAVTSLKIHPFQVMDVALKDYLHLEPTEAMEEIEKLMKEVKAAGGTFSAVWHNESLSDIGRWRGYREIFEEMNRIGFSWANER